MKAPRIKARTSLLAGMSVRDNAQAIGTANKADTRSPRRA